MRLTADRYAFVSFRENGRIFWTKGRLKVQQGEILLTDGRNYAKTRCGSRLSDIPMTPTSITEAPPGLLSSPLEARQFSGLSFVNAPSIGSDIPELAALPSESSPTKSLVAAMTGTTPIESTLLPFASAGAVSTSDLESIGASGGVGRERKGRIAFKDRFDHREHSRDYETHSRTFEHRSSKPRSLPALLNGTSAR